jgi:FHA domain
MATEDMDETMREEEQEQEEEKVQEQPLLIVGGKITKEALCLLDGIQEDAGNSRVILSIRRLPATLGRTHDSSDRNFVGMGSAKALSRQHVRIDYRVPTAKGGCGHIQSKVGYKAEFFYNTEDPVTASEIVMSDSEANLPSTGFYSMTCLGKNRVLVNGKRLEQGQTALLQSGSAIRIANFALYFFQPSTPSEKTLLIRDNVSPAAKKRKLSLGVSSAIPAVAGSGTGEGIATGTSSKPTLQAEIEGLTTKELLKQMKSAVTEDVWDRRHQLIGSTISYRAVLEATHDPAFFQMAIQSDGLVSRGEVMDWIAASGTFGTWVGHMLSKMEAKSYQASVTKSLIKAGFTRTASTGRYIKWHLPASLYKPAQKGEGSPSGSANTDAEDRKNADVSDSSSEGDKDNMRKEDKKDQANSDDDVDKMSDGEAQPVSETGKQVLNEEMPADESDDES